jgi:glycosyltransferase involved in cell wall biosynthesis
MYTLISFATAWGSKHGGINSFNTDFLEHFFYAYSQQVQVICIVAQATPEDVTKAEEVGVTLISLGLTDDKDKPNTAHVPLAIEKLQKVVYEPAKTICLGHDSITGAIAIGVAQRIAAQSALIHHMSYDRYESLAENSRKARQKSNEQKELFIQADVAIAIGPLLRNALNDLVEHKRPTFMLVPGLADLNPMQPASQFTAFMSGRFDESTDKLKQGYLGIGGVSLAHKNATLTQPNSILTKKPKLIVFGADESIENDLKGFSGTIASGQINCQILPFSENKSELYSELAKAHVALMPSWHEGLGLVAWEAIAACVPLVISKESGVYELLINEMLAKNAKSDYVYAIQPQGKLEHPFYTEDDINSISSHIIDIAENINYSKKKATRLKEALSHYTWAACAEQAAQAFQWTLQQGATPKPSQLNPTQNKSTQPLTPAQLLSAENAVVPFDAARQADLDKLIAWLDDETHTIAIRLITGDGGVGKTRLAKELCQQTRPNAHLWLAVEDNNTSWLKEKLPQQPTLIVIDYAETRQTQLLHLINELKKIPNSQAVRILLIARDAGEWWDGLPSKASGSSQALLSSYARSGPFKLNPMYTPKARPQAFDNALTAFAQHLNLTKPNLQPPLDHDYFARPLYIQMAALLSLYGEKRGSAQDLTRALINHEKRYWRQLIQATASPFTADHAQQLMVIATLVGNMATTKEAHQLWQAITENTSTSLTQFTALFNALKQLYPNNQGVSALKPDLLGEALVAQTLNANRLPKLLPVLLSSQSNPKTRQYCLTVLARLSNHYPELENTLVEILKETLAQCVKDLVTVATETPSQLPSYAEQAFQQLTNNTQGQIAGQLKTNLETESIQLDRFYTTIAQYLYTKNDATYQRKPTHEHKRQLSQSLIVYANCLARIGNYNEAVNYAQQALDIDQKLVVTSPVHQPHFSISLNNLANYLSDIGNHTQAFTYAQQALNIRRELAKKNPNQYEPLLASSLTNLGHHLSNMGNHTQAFTYTQQAINIYEKLVAINSEEHESNLAISLNNLANHIGNMGDYQKALAYTQQAHNIYKKLATHNPDKYEPDLARSLGNLSGRLGEVGDYQEALSYAQQVLNIYQELTTHNPDKYEPNLAMSQHNLANRLSDLGNYEQAKQHSQQASETYAQLAVRYPDKFTDDLVNSNLNRLMLEWLDDSIAAEFDSTDIHSQITQASAHKQARFLIELQCLTAINATDNTKKTALFGQILNDWKPLNTADQLTFQAYYLCSLLYLQQHQPSLLTQQGIDAQQAWRDYAKQRNHRIPVWMITVMQQLTMEIPS